MVARSHVAEGRPCERAGKRVVAHQLEAGAIEPVAFGPVHLRAGKALPVPPDIGQAVRGVGIRPPIRGRVVIIVRVAAGRQVALVGHRIGSAPLGLRRRIEDGPGKRPLRRVAEGGHRVRIEEQRPVAAKTALLQNHPVGARERGHDGSGSGDSAGADRVPVSGFEIGPARGQAAHDAGVTDAVRRRADRTGGNVPGVHDPPRPRALDAEPRQQFDLGSPAVGMGLVEALGGVAPERELGLVPRLSGIDPVEGGLVRPQPRHRNDDILPVAAGGDAGPHLPPIGLRQEAVPVEGQHPLGARAADLDGAIAGAVVVHRVGVLQAIDLRDQARPLIGAHRLDQLGLQQLRLLGDREIQGHPRVVGGHEGNDLVILVRPLEPLDDPGLLVRVYDPVDDPELLAGLEVRLVAEDEVEVLPRLSELVAGWKVVAENANESEAVRFGLDVRFRARIDRQGSRPDGRCREPPFPRPELRKQRDVALLATSAHPEPQKDRNRDRRGHRHSAYPDAPLDGRGPAEAVFRAAEQLVCIHCGLVSRWRHLGSRRTADRRVPGTDRAG